MACPRPPLPRRPLAALVSALLLSACEDVICFEGRITDSVTGAPLEDVQCDGTAGEERFEGTTYDGESGPLQVLSDADGRYEVCKLVGCVFGCRVHLDVRFSRTGYLTRTLRDPGDVALTPDTAPQGAPWGE